MHDIKTNFKKTIDLSGIIDNERQKWLIKNWYLQDYSLTEKFIMKFPKITKILLVWGLCFVVLAVLIPISETNALEGQLDGIRNNIRQERLEVCQKAYKESGINKQFLYEQIPAVRCATYMTLIYAYESNYGKSKKCTVQKNCHGMKWNWINHPAWFISFNTYKESKEWFANRYFKFHYKKSIRVFISNWSMTDRETYIDFVENNYWETYRELELMYLLW